MKKILRKIILIFSFTLSITSNVNAQKVFIPDPHFRALLRQTFPVCMIGDSIDPTCPGVLNTKRLDVSNSSIANLAGIEVFVNDSALDCNYNQLVNLPLLPPLLEWIDCSNNLLTSLPNLPTTLYYLDCSHNQLTNLPNLPSSLRKLFCNGNQLTSLPALPTKLPYIDCSNNQLTSLPPLSDSLSCLYANFNNLTSLPPLPDSLKILTCGYNQLGSLPTLPPALFALACYFSQLTSLPVLPNTICSLECGYNQLTSLPPLPSDLVSLKCESNQLTSLPYLPSKIYGITCYSNQLTSLPALPVALQGLWCDTNQLSSLPEFPNALTSVSCNFNPITCLPNLNKLSSLRFSNTLITCLPNRGNVTYSIPSITSFPLCNAFNNNGCDVLWNIEGKSYLDFDADCILDNNEKVLSKQRVKLYKNGILDQLTYTNSYGDYSFDTFSFDEYKTEIDTISIPFMANCPVIGFYTDTISVADSLKEDRDFALICKGTDLAATSIAAFGIQPGETVLFRVKAGNVSNSYGFNCGAGVCGIVTITITGPGSYLSPTSYSLTPTSVSGNVLTYNIADFGAISYESSFDFLLLVDTNAVIDSMINVTVNIYTNCVQELNYNNNQISLYFIVAGSYDPNDKAVSPTTTMDLSGNRWLTYTIRFQNTGTAAAKHIIITDTLSNDLILSTFTFLSSSHDPIIDLKIDNNRLLIFQFPYIYLPDSNTNEPASHGCAQFKIKAKDSLTVGNTIENTANIYFDFNAPVITNTTSNTIIDCNILTTNLSATLCNGDVYTLNGMEYYSTGIYKQNLLTAFGCDSTVRLNLTVNKSAIARSNDTLQATTLNAITYQWINCTTGTAIVGANTQTFNPTQSGNYAVVVDFGTCKDTSTCYYFSAVGINEINASNISIQPNPFNNELKVTLDKNYDGVLEIYNTIGELITAEKLQSKNVTLNTSNWNVGVYILKVATNEGVVMKKVVKK